MRTPIGMNWEELREQILTKEERQELSDKVRLIGALIEARQECEMTQQKIERGSRS